jgi:hypothetical protein
MKKKHPSLLKIFKAMAAMDTVKQRILAACATEKPYLPVNEEKFSKCSRAIHYAADRGGTPLPLPSSLLPPV